MRKRNLFVTLIAVTIVGLIAIAELPELLKPDAAAKFLKDHPRRLQMWSACIDYIKQHPWMGGGLGNFKVQFQYLVKDRKDRYTYYDQAHNEIIQVWFEMGIVGFLLSLGFVCGLVRSFVRYKRHAAAGIRGACGDNYEQPIQFSPACGDDGAGSRHMDGHFGIREKTGVLTNESKTDLNRVIVDSNLRVLDRVHDIVPIQWLP